MADEIFQNVLDIYQEKKVIISKAHSCNHLGYQSPRGKIEKALYGIHVLNEYTSYPECLERIEDIPELPDIDVTEARKIFLHQFVESYSPVSHLGHNLYVHALVDKKQDVLQKLHSDCHVDFTLFESPLHLAVECRLLHMVEFLVNEKGMDVNCVDNKGNTPLHHLMKYNEHVNWALRRKIDNSVFTEVLQFLKSKGANLLVHNKKGRTPLQYAIIHKNISDVNQFIDMCSDFGDFNHETRVEVLELLAAKQMFDDSEEVSVGGVNSYKLALAERRKQNIPNTRKKPPQELFFDSTVEPDTENSEFLDLICTAGGKRKRLILGLLIYERIIGCKHFRFLKGCREYLKILCRGVCHEDESTHHFLQSLKYHFSFLKNEKVLKKRPCKFYEMRDLKDFEDLCNVENVTHKIVPFRHFYLNSDKYTTEELLDVLLSLYAGSFQMKIEEGVMPSEEDKVGLLYFLDTILSRSLSEENELTLKKALKTIVSAGNSIKFGSLGLIHCIVCPMLLFESDYKEENCDFSHGPEILERLLDCGASIHELIEGNMNILHWFFTSSIDNFNGDAYQDFPDDEVQNFNDQLRRIVNIALERGLHVDQKTDEDYGFETVLDEAEDTEFYPLVNNPKYRSLKCLATSVIIEKDIPFRNEVPKELIHWIDFHMGNKEFYY